MYVDFGALVRLCCTWEAQGNVGTELVFKMHATARSARFARPRVAECTPVRVRDDRANGNDFLGAGGGGGFGRAGTRSGGESFDGGSPAPGRVWYLVLCHRGEAQPMLCFAPRLEALVDGVRVARDKQTTIGPASRQCVPRV